jgi:hypothetical protein
MKKSLSPKIWVPAIALTGAMFYAAPASAGTPSALNFSTTTTTAAATNTLGSTNTQTLATLMTWYDPTSTNHLGQMAPTAKANAKSFSTQIHHLNSSTGSVLSFPTQPTTQNQVGVFNLEANAKQTGMVGVPTSALFSAAPQDNSNDPDLQMIANMQAPKIDTNSVPTPILLSPLQSEYVATVRYNAAEWAQTPEGQAAMTNSASAQSAAPDARTEINEILNH